MYCIIVASRGKLLCEEVLTPIEVQNALSIPQNFKFITMMKP
jgi:hypothetical protein